jgi:putative MATE family efflux protein
MGASTIISRKLGEKDNDRASTVLSSAFAAAIFAGILVAALCLPALPYILKLIGASDTILPYAMPYATIILIGAPISCSVFVLNNALRSEGDAKLSMWAMMTSGILNVILDPILIFGAGMGSGGAALATVISQLVSFCILLSTFIRKKTVLRISLKKVSKSAKDYLQIITSGLPTIFRQGLGSLSSTVLNVSALAYGGDATVAAIHIANKIYTLIRNLIIGIGQGFQPVAGYNYGAGNKKRAFSAFLFATALGTGICVTAGVIVSIFAEPIMWWFCDSAEVARIGTQTVLISMAVVPFMAFSTFVNQLYQCLGFRTIATLLASCRQGIFFIPTIIILPKFLDCLGVQMTQPLADLMTFIVSIPFAIHFYRKEFRRSEIQNQT